MLGLRVRGFYALVKVASNGFKEDPIHFSLLVSRRMATSNVFLKASGLIDRLLCNPVAAKFAFSRRIRASIMLLQGHPYNALRLLGEDRETKTLLVRARALAFLGEYESALAQAKAAGKPGMSLARQYASEIEVLTASPDDVGCATLTAEVQTKRVMHLLTNSLPFTNSGYTQRSHSVLKSLQESGWEVVAYTRIGYPWLVGILPAHDMNVVNSVTYRRLLPTTLPKTMSDRLDLQTEMLLEAVAEHEPTIMHTTTEFLNGRSVNEVARSSGIPWVYEVRGQLADTWLSGSQDRSRDSFRYLNFKSREAEIASAADAVITLGSTMKDELVAAGVDANKILICPNAVGDEFIDDMPNRQESRKALHLDVDAQLIGTVSSIVGYEGLDLLVRSFARLVDQYPMLWLVIVGDGVERTNLMKLARDLGVFDRTVFPGRVEKSQARLYHRALDVFVVPRRDLDVTRAVTPLKPVEAMAFEVPVVATDLPALREIVTDGADGLLFEPGVQSDLTDKLRILLDDRELRVRMGQAGRKKVLETRTWAANAERIDHLYGELIGKAGED